MIKIILLAALLLFSPWAVGDECKSNAPKLCNPFKNWLQRERGKIPRIKVIPPTSEYAKYLRSNGAVINPLRVIEFPGSLGPSSFNPIVFEDRSIALNNPLKAKLILLEKQKVCVALVLTNTSKHDIYITRIQVPQQGARPIPNFILLSTGKPYNYNGPLDMRKAFTKEDYLKIPTQQDNVTFHCLADYFKLDSPLKSIQYVGLNTIYKASKNPNLMIKVGEQRVVSNSVLLK
ncbi:hypothetical protein [Thiofilum flexile]|uniref:hypothetical protein n=1 Tax=Thiofilum flexile TaxID=125627 RepID=UPI000379A9D9|nr:hypothetical protein [Thiofilum flexile]